MPDVTVLILLRPLPADSGPLEQFLHDARARLAQRQVRAFGRVGATQAWIVSAPSPGFGPLVRDLAGGLDTTGLVIVGAGAIPLATDADRRAFVACAAAREPGALANNRYSADVVAISGAHVLLGMPDLPGDNALPRWLEEVAGVPVRDLRERWKLAVDLDSPADLVLPRVARATGSPADAADLRRAAERLSAVREQLRDRRAEVVVAGRTSASTLRALERGSAARIRALVEERGLRAASRLALHDGMAGEPGPSARPRPPRSVLGMLLDRDGPGALGRILAELGDAAIVNSRVLLAHRLGADEAAWPRAEDRFASDLLIPDRVGDPWLRELTTAALEAPIPVALGGHTLVGPGLRLVVEQLRQGPRPAPDGTRGAP